MEEEQEQSLGRLEQDHEVEEEIENKNHDDDGEDEDKYDDEYDEDNDEDCNDKDKSRDDSSASCLLHRQKTVPRSHSWRHFAAKKQRTNNNNNPTVAAQQQRRRRRSLESRRAYATKLACGQVNSRHGRRSNNAFRNSPPPLSSNPTVVPLPPSCSLPSPFTDPSSLSSSPSPSEDHASASSFSSLGMTPPPPPLLLRNDNGSSGGQQQNILDATVHVVPFSADFSSLASSRRVMGSHDEALLDEEEAMHGGHEEYTSAVLPAISAVAVESAVSVQTLGLARGADASSTTTTTTTGQCRRRKAKQNDNNARWIRCGHILIVAALALAMTGGILVAVPRGIQDPESNSRSTMDDNNNMTVTRPVPLVANLTWHEQKWQTLQSMVVQAMTDLAVPAGQETRNTFHQTSSLQFRAAQWMTTVDEWDHDLVYFTAHHNHKKAPPWRKQRLLDRFAMVTLHLLSPQSESLLFPLRATSHCEWQTKNRRWNYSRTSPSCIRGLSFVENRFGLVGTLPPEVALLSSLFELYLTDNDISGTLPWAWGHGLCGLSKFFGPGNALSGGAIPHSWTHLSRLASLRLGNNQLQSLGGHWPSGLQELWLESNQLVGTLPPDGLPPSLDHVVLRNNQLTGTIPTWLGRLAQLKELSLSLNFFQGTIPSCLFSMPSLQVLSLRDNHLTGPVFPFHLNMSTSVSLQRIYLSGNHLSGHFHVAPPLATPLPWRTLDVSDNQITGTLSTHFWSTLPQLQTLILSRNQLGGPLRLPPNNHQTSSLVYLSLSRNRFHGTIPFYHLPLSRQRPCTLDLSHNEFTGTLPDFWGSSSSSSLAELHLQDNRLTGTIPTLWWQTLPLLRTLDIRQNLLTGNISFLCHHPKAPLVIRADCIRSTTITSTRNDMDARVVCDCCENCL